MKPHPDTKEKLARSLEVCRKAGMRITRPRKKILNLLIQEHGPFTMEELHRRLGKGCDLATVYRILTAMEKLSLVRRCDFADGSCRYEFGGDAGHHHHHIICKICRKVEKLDDCDLDAMDQVVRNRGYRQVSHSLEFFGVCPRCRKSH